MSEMNEQMKRNVSVAMEQSVALEMLQNLDSNDSDGGDLSEGESDSDHYWVNESTSSSSESDSEFIPRKKRRLSLETKDPDVQLTAKAPGELCCPFLLCCVMLWYVLLLKL